MGKNNLFLKFNKENFNFFKMKNSIIEFFLNHSELLFMLFFAVMAVFSSMLIYKYIYSSVWSDKKKEVYLQDLKKGEIEFNVKDFNAVVEKVKERNTLYVKDSAEEVRDIFGIEK
ncbi:MAG: hypothetical protein ACD_7C00312G0017 [uncultured bacterium]|nr:MAG: hypothetical protein ACD_7C00312G0017 [uncultured bacterium]KKP68058.1 MAG: hypothetical protein UR66_C0009G0148 [Candidatus Moranbacteria bacterium GW2011_GWE1_35_17]KKP73005.1 MAG: hypothetical protein UR65_C0009G0009 [Candidatus Moranbacteria bacterium GW2011_GWE2_35_164]KKP84725.1 MAG: hypothetical protein UR83_C0014G0028 [Candidatus Moranbacteria bacterium GW2011_GWF2_35_54]HBR79300.1 hypothetical protein [Candidatus Moranbacteria bacterium]